MPLDKSLYTRFSRLHEESRFEYHGVSFTPDEGTSDEILKRDDEYNFTQACKRLPRDSNEWRLDYILVETAPQLTHTFMFKRLRRRP